MSRHCHIEGSGHAPWQVMHIGGDETGSVVAQNLLSRGTNVFGGGGSCVGVT
jgi:hypothetical protein